MEADKKRYTISRETSTSFGEALERARTLLQEAGYVKEKLGIEREPYVILGACNPPLARQGLDAEPELGTLLPCNVVVYEQGGRTHEAAVEPEAMLSVVGNEALEPIAKRVREDLTRVVEETAGA